MANTLSRAARATLSAAGIKPATYITEMFGADGWRGDVCGCTDDRCAGYHHDEDEECECLPSIIESWKRDEAMIAAREGSK